MNVSDELELDNACILGNISNIKKYVKKGVDIDPKFDSISKTPLYWTAYQNQIEAMIFLLTSEELDKHPKAQFPHDDLVSLFRCERVKALEYLVYNHHLTYDESVIPLIYNQLGNMNYSNNDNIEKLNSLANYMEKYLEKTLLEKNTLNLDTLDTSKNKMKL